MQILFLTTLAILSCSLTFAAPATKTSSQGGHVADETALNFLWVLAREVPKFVTQNQISIPVYGNYCGPNYGDTTYEQNPIDSIDATCQTHDACYDSAQGGRYQSCACDMLMVSDIAKAIVQFGLPPEAYVAGVAMSAYFAQSPCECRKGHSLQRLEAPNPFEKAACEFEPGSGFHY